MTDFPSYYSAVIKYSEKPIDTAPSEEYGFQKHLEENPLDENAALAYADWLRDQGREAEATILTHETKNDHAHYEGKRVRPLIRKNKSGGGFPGKHAYIYFNGSRRSLLSIGLPSVVTPGHHYHLQAWTSPEEAKSLLNELAKDGYSLAGVHYPSGDAYADDSTREVSGLPKSYKS